MWKQERFKRMQEAKLVRDSLLKDELYFNVRLYHGHREIVVKWQEKEVEKPLTA